MVEFNKIIFIIFICLLNACSAPSQNQSLVLVDSASEIEDSLKHLKKILCKMPDYKFSFCNYEKEYEYNLIPINKDSVSLKYKIFYPLSISDVNSLIRLSNYLRNNYISCVYGQKNPEDTTNIGFLFLSYKEDEGVYDRYNIKTILLKEDHHSISDKDTTWGEFSIVDRKNNLLLLQRLRK